MRRLWLAGVAACSALWAGPSSAAPVKVDGGFVQEIAEADLTVYKGAPLAARPSEGRPLAFTHALDSTLVHERR